MGDFVEITLEQRGDNLGLVLLDPEGRQVLEVDTPNGSYGRERLFAVADTTGEHRVEIVPFGPGGGEHTLRFERRRATAQDRRRARACRLLYDGWLSGAGGDEALGKAEEALTLWRELGDRYLEAVTGIRLGRLHLARSDPERSTESVREALEIVESQGLGDLEAETLLVLGASLEQRGRQTEAEEVYRRARSAAFEARDRWHEAVACNELGRVLYDRRSRLWEAYGLLSQAAEIQFQLDDPEERAHALHNRGRVLFWLGREGDALRDLEEALVLKRQVGDEPSAARTLLEIGWIHIWRGDLAAAERGILDALRSAGDRDQELAASCLDRLGTLYRHQGRLAEARDSYRRALEAFRALEAPGNEAHALSNLGRVQTELGEPERAIELFETALRIFRREGDLSGRAFALAYRAEAWIERGDPLAAERDLREALELHESLRLDTRSPGFRASYLDTVYDHFQLYIDLAMDLEVLRPGEGWARKALATVERSRSRSLLDLISRLETDREASEERAALHRSLLTLDRQRRSLETTGAAEEEIQAVADRLRDVARRLEHLEGRAAETHLPELRDPSAIRGLLDEDTSLLVFSLGAERGFVWLVGADGLRWGALPGRMPIREAVMGLLKSLRSAPDAFFQAESLDRELEVLGTLLLEPISNGSDREVPTGPLPPRLVVIPDGPLHYLPFAALRLGGRYLQESHEVIRLPSASVLVALRERRRGREPPPGLLAVIADPVLQPDDPRLDAAAAAAAAQAVRADGVSGAGGQGFEDLERLRESGREADALLSRVATTPTSCRFDARGHEAGPEVLRHGRLGGYRLVHLATHAVLEDDSPELSRVVLSQIDELGRPRDGAVRSFEIAKLDLNADLVVLSACATALGEELRGEGLVGLPQSFFEAGADRVVVSLWSVDDRATAKLMNRFYRRLLAEGLSPGEALRRAQTALRETEGYAAPYYWAPFTLIGDWAPLPSTLLASPCLHP